MVWGMEEWLLKAGKMVGSGEGRMYGGRGGGGVGGGVSLVVTSPS
jgi:hypothetical protein